MLVVQPSQLIIGLDQGIVWGALALWVKHAVNLMADSGL